MRYLSQIRLGLLIGLGLLIPGNLQSAPSAASPVTAPVLSKEGVLAGIEKRYAGAGFSARFDQISTIKAMEITDAASGRIMVKRPGKMRWVYERPDRQTIVTDGKTLWVYKPDDNQVMVGSYPTFFGDGKGASFLSDMGLVRRKFKISLLEGAAKDQHMLKLLPVKAGYEVSSVHLLVSAATFDILRISTFNADGDETRIELKDTDFTSDLDDGLFHFNIPEGINILQLDE